MAIDFEPHLTHDGLDWFVSWCLFEGDVWESPRTSDGVPSFEVERETDAWRVRGRIWAIEQTVHAFELELRPDATWTLRFEGVELRGSATVRDGRLVPA